MGKFTKTNQTILKDGSVDYIDNQQMGGTPATNDGNRITDASPAILSGDYVIKSQFEDSGEHSHDFADPIHDNTQHSPNLSLEGHTHSISSKTQIDGYVKMGDLWLQWGRHAIDVSATTNIIYNLPVSYGEPFPNGTLSVQLSTLHWTDVGDDYTEMQFGIRDKSASGFTVNGRRITGKQGTGTFFLTWMAWGV